MRSLLVLFGNEMNIIKTIFIKRNLLAFFFGVCATLTLAPIYIFPLIIPAYGGLFWLVSNATTKKRAFADGWWWGFGFFTTGLYWFCIALLTDPEKFAWAIPFCLVGLNGIIALYPAVACLLYFLLRHTDESRYPVKCLSWIPTFVGMTATGKAITFSTIWLVVEYARSHLFSGFPWNLAGYSFGFSDISLQLASIIGIYGLTFFTVLLGVSAVIIRTNRIFLLSIWSLFTISLIWGNYRLENAKEGEPTGVLLRLVQANIQQNHKWNPDLQKQGLDEHIRLTNSEGLDKITHVIWPETATPYALRSDTSLTKYLGSSLPNGVQLITGALRVEGDENNYNIYNSAVMLDNSGKIIGNYDKHALVPFGEFIPLRFLIPSWLKLPVGNKDFSRGNGAETKKWQGLPPVSVLICYEGIFPETAVDMNNRPEWLLNITNDAWFGMSSGPHQHFEMVRMRAVEQGLPLVRIANTGITAYIDEYGRIKGQIPLGEQGVLDMELHKSTLDGTIYSEF